LKFFKQVQLAPNVDIAGGSNLSESHSVFHLIALLVLLLLVDYEKGFLALLLLFRL